MLLSRYRPYYRDYPERKKKKEKGKGKGIGKRRKEKRKDSLKLYQYAKLILKLLQNFLSYYF